jgi:hypothetical protein
MVFERFETGSWSGFHPYVYNADTDIRIEATGRDMPKDRKLVTVYSGKRPVFAFKVSWKYVTEEKMVVYSGSLAKIKQLFDEFGKRFDPSISEELLISQIEEGGNLMFLQNGYVTQGWGVRLELA